MRLTTAIVATPVLTGSTMVTPRTDHAASRRGSQRAGGPESSSTTNPPKARHASMHRPTAGTDASSLDVDDPPEPVLRQTAYVPTSVRRQEAPNRTSDSRHVIAFRLGDLCSKDPACCHQRRKTGPPRR